MYFDVVVDMLLDQIIRLQNPFVVKEIWRHKTLYKIVCRKVFFFFLFFSQSRTCIAQVKNSTKNKYFNRRVNLKLDST